MEEGHRSILRKNRTAIIDNVANPMDVADGLYTHDIFTEAMKQEVEAAKTTVCKVRKILDIIPRRGPQAFDGFTRVLLETKNDYVLGVLRPGWAETQQGDIVAGERGHAILQPAVDLPEDWPNEAAMTAAVQVTPCNVNSHIVKDYWLNPAVYSMKKGRRGRCVIISNQVFYGPLELVNGVMRLILAARHGTVKDEKDLTELFTQLHFTIVSHNEKNAEEILTVLKKESQHPDHKDAECFICIICSHGTRDGIYGIDGEVISFESVTSVFESHNCPALSNKPKLFFIQACQGEDKDKGTVAMSSPNIDSLLPRLEQLNVGDAQRERNLEQQSTGDSIPTKVDMFVACATHPGYVSLRNTVYGSWFIQAVIYVFQRHAHKEAITDLLTLVNDLVAKGRTYDDVVQQEIMQAAYYRSSLRKKFYFFPGIIQAPDS